jgi:hypothetical protein
VNERQIVARQRALNGVRGKLEEPATIRELRRGHRGRCPIAEAIEERAGRRRGRGANRIELADDQERGATHSGDLYGEYAQVEAL